MQLENIFSEEKERLNNVKTIIFDSNNESRENIVNLVESFISTIQIVKHTSSIDAFFESVNQLDIDLLILDSSICTHPDFNQLDKLRFQKKYFQIVLVAGGNGTMKQALDIGAVGYLRRPLKPHALKLCLERVKRTIIKQKEVQSIAQEQNCPKMIIIPDSTGYKLVNADKIIYLKADRTYVHIILENERFFVSKRLKDYAPLFPDGMFFRSHRSYLVNIDHITHFAPDSGGYFIMSNGDQVSVSRDRRRAFFDLFQYGK